MTQTPPLPTERLSNRLEELRASVAAEAAGNRVAARLQAAILKLFEMLLALLADFAAGKLAPAAPEPHAARAAGEARAPAAMPRAKPVAAPRQPAPARQESPDDRPPHGEGMRDAAVAPAAAAGVPARPCLRPRTPIPAGKRLARHGQIHSLDGCNRFDINFKNRRLGVMLWRDSNVTISK